jgi:hypothetical protein
MEQMKKYIEGKYRANVAHSLIAIVLKIPASSSDDNVRSIDFTTWDEATTYRSIYGLQGGFVGSQDFVGGQFLEFQTYNSHGNCFYVYLMSISTLMDVEISYSDYLVLQTDIRSK